MYAVTLYGREVVVRSRFWFGPFHSLMYEVCDVSGGEPYTPIAVFDCVDDVWKYIAAEGHRVRNWKSWLLTTIDVYQKCREIEECIASQSESDEDCQPGDDISAVFWQTSNSFGKE